MKTIIKSLKQDNSLIVLSDNNGKQLKETPAAVYSVSLTPEMSVVLRKKMDKFTVPSIVYGSTNKVRISRIIKSLSEKGLKTWGLSGIYGSGKSMSSQIVANAAIDKGHPVIMIDEPYSPSLLESIIDKVGNCCLIFDEFHNTYPDKSDDVTTEEGLLSFLSSERKERVTLLLCTNKEFSPLYCRPGRLKGLFTYKNDIDVFIDILGKELISSRPYESMITSFLSVNSCLSIDHVLMLKGIIEQSPEWEDFIYNLDGFPIPALYFPTINFVPSAKDDSKVLRPGVLDDWRVSYSVDGVVLYNKTLGERETFYYSEALPKLPYSHVPVSGDIKFSLVQGFNPVSRWFEDIKNSSVNIDDVVHVNPPTPLSAKSIVLDKSEEPDTYYYARSRGHIQTQ
jgi:hypothetical protein